MIKVSRKDLGLAPVPKAKVEPPAPPPETVDTDLITQRLEKIEELLALMGNAVPGMVKSALTKEIKALVATRPAVQYEHEVIRAYEPDGPIKRIISTPVKPH